jgi:two-component sensor histidine kinase
MNRGIPCGLIVNELLTNAYKHAFPKSFRKKMTISISMVRIGRKTRQIISDNGIGLPKSVTPEKTRSLGFQLVKTLIQQLEGTLKVSQKDGTTFTFIFE